MTPGQAINELTGHLDGSRYEFRQTYKQAVQLGIEALKQMKAERTIYGFKRHNKMPGETEE